MPAVTPHVRALAEILVDYHRLSHTLVVSDCILALGTNDPRVAERAAEVYFEGFAPLIVFSGNVSPSTAGLYSTSEAEAFARIALERGVPKSALLLETRATNTGENFLFSRALLTAHAIPVRSAIVVQKPYMERRCLATAQKVWPELSVRCTSPNLTLAEFAQPWLSEESVIHIIVGDLQRIILYPALGFQVAQELPAEVTTAYEELVQLGFTGHLIGEHIAA